MEFDYSRFDRATIIQHQSSKVSHANTGSIALPALLRTGDTGQAQFSTGSVQKAKYPTSESSHLHNSYYAYPMSNVSVVVPLRKLFQFLDLLLCAQLF